MKTQSLTGYSNLDKPWLKFFENDAEKYVTEKQNISAYQYLYNLNRDNLHYIALTYFGNKITYKDLFRNIETVAKALKAYGICKGDFITLCLPNIPEMVYFIYAIIYIGAIACLIDPRTNSEGILKCANDSKSKLLVVISDIVNSKIDSISDELIAENIVVISPANSAKSILVKAKYKFTKNSHHTKKYIKYMDFIRQSILFPNVDVCNCFLDETAIIIYTSGTTGNRKGVMISNENIIASHKIIKFGATQLKHNANFLGVIPFFSAYGALTGMNNALCSGWNIILIPKYKPKDFGKLIIQNDIECVIGVPRFWESFANNNKAVDLSKLKNPVSGGDKIAPAALERVNQYLLRNGANRLKVGYGASEFGGGIVITTDNGPYEPESVGEILPGVIGIVIDPDTGKELLYGQDGELCFYSPTMMKGYFEREDETSAITIYKNDIKYYRTGDKGHISKNGTVYIVDRYKRVMMRPDGHTVHASPIENVIASHSMVKACAVVGIPLDESAGVIPTAFIVLSPDHQYKQEDIIREIDFLCKQKLPERDKAHAYVITDHLPYTLMGKINYKELEDNRFNNIDYIVADNTFLTQKQNLQQKKNN